MALFCHYRRGHRYSRQLQAGQQLNHKLSRQEPVRFPGMDDWSWRRRLRYGAILVDLERHRVVDLPPDREVESTVE